LDRFVDGEKPDSISFSIAQTFSLLAETERNYLKAEVSAVWFTSRFAFDIIDGDVRSCAGQSGQVWCSKLCRDTYTDSGSYGPRLKKADMHWCAPGGAKTPVIPIAKIGYVKESEVRVDPGETDLDLRKAHDSHLEVCGRRVRNRLDRYPACGRGFIMFLDLG